MGNLICTMLTTPTPTAADLRAAIARHRLKLYIIAPRVGLHPANLSVVLNEHRPLSPELAQRLMSVITEEASAPA